MVIAPTAEMLKLEPLFDSYRENNGRGGVSSSAPKEAQEAYKKYLELFKKEFEEAEALLY